MAVFHLQLTSSWPWELSRGARAPSSGMSEKETRGKLLYSQLPFVMGASLLGETLDAIPLYFRKDFRLSPPRRRGAEGSVCVCVRSQLQKHGEWDLQDQSCWALICLSSRETEVLSAEGEGVRRSGS